MRSASSARSLAPRPGVCSRSMDSPRGPCSGERMKTPLRLRAGTAAAAEAGPEAGPALVDGRRAAVPGAKLTLEEAGRPGGPARAAEAEGVPVPSTTEGERSLRRGEWGVIDAARCMSSQATLEVSMGSAWSFAASPNKPVALSIMRA